MPAENYSPTVRDRGAGCGGKDCQILSRTKYLSKLNAKSAANPCCRHQPPGVKQPESRQLCMKWTGNPSCRVPRMSLLLNCVLNPTHPLGIWLNSKTLTNIHAQCPLMDPLCFCFEQSVTRFRISSCPFPAYVSLAGYRRGYASPLSILPILHTVPVCSHRSHIPSPP